MEDFTISNIVMFTHGALEAMNDASMTITGYCALAEAAATAAGKEIALNPEAMYGMGQDWANGEGYAFIIED